MPAKRILLWCGAALLVANALWVFHAAQAYSLLAHRVRLFNQAGVVRLDTKDCRKPYRGHDLCCQCVLEFQKSAEKITIRTTGADDEVLLEVHACGLCRTDLHVTEGELPPKRDSVIPGHQIVGTIVAAGKNSGKYPLGMRVGVPWLHRTCGVCEYCRGGYENLCERALFTGYSVNGGYAEYVVAPEAFVYPIPDSFTDIQAAPLLCAGIIGFRSLRLANLKRGDVLGIYGFGAAGHVAIQVAKHWGISVMVSTREPRHQKLACELGAEWVGGAYDDPPEKLHAAIIFAPAGELVPAALAVLRKAGTLVLGGIHMSAIPSFSYDLLYHERVVRSVANNTRQDGMDFLRVAAEIPIHTETQVFPLAEANQALQALKHDGIRGAGVLKIR